MHCAGARNRSVDLLKGILAVFVITLHFNFPESVVKTYTYQFLVNKAVPMFIFVSGYVSALSYEKKGIRDFESAYGKDNLTGRLTRLLIPFALFFMAEQILFRVIGLYKVNIFEYGILALFFDFLTGGKGQGSYYIPIMIQFTFLFPVIYFCIKKRGFKGLVGMYAINLVFEVLKQAYGMPDLEYRLIVLRYLGLIAAGCYVALDGCADNREKFLKDSAKRFLWVIMFFVGLFFVWFFCFSGYRPKIFTMWSDTSMLPCMYIVPLMWLYVNKSDLKCRPFELMGKASWHIFLFQMLYYIYYYNTGTILRLNPGKGYLISVLVCVLGGVGFYLIQINCMRLFKHMKKR